MEIQSEFQSKNFTNEVKLVLLKNIFIGQEVVYPKKIEQIQVISVHLIIFESCATNNTAPLDLCGGYRLG